MRQTGQEAVISYDEIPKIVDAVDKNAPPAVKLSKYQAKLYRRLMSSRIQGLGSLGRFVDGLTYGLLTVLALLTARNLLLLGYFHRVDEKSISRINYEDVNDIVIVRFNSCR